MDAERFERTIGILRKDIFERVSDASAHGVVLGVSGGVDSAVVCALCADVVDTKALIMPDSSAGSAADQEDGIAVCEAFDVPYSVIELEKPLEALLLAYSSDVRNNRYVVANVKARMRMTYLYLAANKEKRLVAGTSNKTERLLGYSTKWGDGAADFLPIGDVWKTDVFRMARVLGVPSPIVDKPPSARLWEGQTDEGELGGTYEEIDAILKDMEQGDTAACKGNRALLASLLERMESNSHKASMPPFPEAGL